MAPGNTTVSAVATATGHQLSLHQRAQISMDTTEMTFIVITTILAALGTASMASVTRGLVSYFTHSHKIRSNMSVMVSEINTL